jgi:hypothetical protein
MLQGMMFQREKAASNERDIAEKLVAVMVLARILWQLLNVVVAEERVVMSVVVAERRVDEKEVVGEARVGGAGAILVGRAALEEVQGGLRLIKSVSDCKQ